MRPAALGDVRQHHRRFASRLLNNLEEGGRMTGNDFVKEMQKALLTQQEHDDPASQASPNVKVLQTEAHKEWDALVTWMEGKVAEINNGLPEPLLRYSKPREEEFELANEAANMSVTVKGESDGNVVYRGTTASGMFRAQPSEDGLSYSWERRTSTSSMRFAFGSLGVNVTLKEIGELIIRSVVTP
jgi:hypothetical protein